MQLHPVVCISDLVQCISIKQLAGYSFPHSHSCTDSCLVWCDVSYENMCGFTPHAQNLTCVVSTDQRKPGNTGANVCYVMNVYVSMFVYGHS